MIIEDDGDGIPDDDHGRIFEPGWTTRPNGTGLGLPLARRLARSVGGDITALPGNHGNFQIILPQR